MLKQEDRKQLIKVAKLYYFEELTQAKISEKMGVSRPVISKMLRKAREEGIVEIKIHDEGFGVTELEQKIAMHFKLDDVMVVPTENMSKEQAKATLGRSAANYVSHAMRGITKIGVSWGESLNEMVKEYPIEQRENVKVIPLVGGVGSQAVELHSNQIAFELAKKMNSESKSLYAPAIVESVELKESLIQSPHISSVLEQGRDVDLAIIGIGNPYAQSTMVKFGYLGEKELTELKQAQVVGDIGSRYILEDGTEARTSINQQVIGVELDDLKKIKRVVGIAAGLHKVASIIATLRGGYLDILLTDDQTAAAIVEQINTSE